MGTMSAVVHGSAVLSIGTAEATASTALGFTEDGIKITGTKNVEKMVVDELPEAIGAHVTFQELKIEANLSEMTQTAMDLLLGGKVTSGSIQTDGTVTYRSAKVVVTGLSATGTTITTTITIPRCYAEGGGTPVYSAKANKHVYPITLCSVASTAGTKITAVVTGGSGS